MIKFLDNVQEYYNVRIKIEPDFSVVKIYLHTIQNEYSQETYSHIRLTFTTREEWETVKQQIDDAWYSIEPNSLGDFPKKVSCSICKREA